MYELVLNLGIYLSMRQLNRRAGDIESEAIFRSQFVSIYNKKKSEDV